MALIVPDDVAHLRAASKKISLELEALAKSGNARWSDDQSKELGKIYQIVLNTHDALFHMIDANKES